MSNNSFETRSDRMGSDAAAEAAHDAAKALLEEYKAEEKLSVHDVVLHGLYRIPTTAGGFAMGILALVGVWKSAETNFLKQDLAPHLDVAETVLVVWGFLVYFMYVLKTVLAPRKVLFETKYANTLAAIAAAPMATCALASKLYEFSTESESGQKAAQIIWWCGFAGQFVVTGKFIYLIIRDKTPPATFYFPPLCNVAIAALTGSHFIHLSIKLASFYASFAVSAIIFPIIAWRVIKSDLVAAGPAIALLQLPPAIMTRCFYTTCVVNVETKMCDAHPGLPLWLGSVFAALSFFSVLLTAACALRRSDAIWMSWFTPSWAAFTIPTASSAIAANLYAHHQNSKPIFVLYAFSMSILATFVVLSVNAVAFSHTIAWLFWRRAKASETSVLSPSEVPSDMRSAAAYANECDELPLSAGYSVIPTVSQVNASTITRAMRHELSKRQLWRGRGWSVRVANMQTSAQAVHGFGDLHSGVTASASKLNAGALPSNPRLMREALERKGLFRNRGWSIRVANMQESSNAIHGFDKPIPKERKLSM